MVVLCSVPVSAASGGTSSLKYSRSFVIFSFSSSTLEFDNFFAIRPFKKNLIIKF